MHSYQVVCIQELGNGITKAFSVLCMKENEHEALAYAKKSTGMRAFSVQRTNPTKVK